MFRIAHFAGRASEKPNLRQCGQLSIAGVQHGRFHVVAGGRRDGRVSEILRMVEEGGRGGGWIGGGRRRDGAVGVGSFGLGAEAGDGLPVVLARLKGEPLRQGHDEEAAEGLGVRLVESAHLAEALARGFVVAELDAALSEQVVKLAAAAGREAVGGAGVRCVGDGAEIEDLREVDERVAGHGEGELGLAGLETADTGG
jgi:hypothetical protein